MSTPGYQVIRILRRAPWAEVAACRGMGPALWYPPRGEDPRPAQRICADCPVQAECADAGRSERWGIWGGTTERERRRLRHTDGLPDYFWIRPAR